MLDKHALAMISILSYLLLLLKEGGGLLMHLQRHFFLFDPSRGTLLVNNVIEIHIVFASVKFS